MKVIGFIIVISGIFFCAVARNDAGLILSGIDTISTDYKTKYFDFLSTAPCSTYGFPTDPCNGHIGIQFQNQPGDTGYILYTTNSNGLAKDTGKQNLDSIKYAPPDSIMKSDLGIGVGRIFLIRPDSLKKCIGNCYIIKTGIDPRRGNQLYAKIKILAFELTDSANNIVKMKFLWTYNDNGFRDLRTSGLDTFHLDTTPTLSRHNQLAANLISRANGGQHVFKVVGERFVVPEELRGKVTTLDVFDLKGKKLGSIEAGNKNGVELRSFFKSRCIVVLKFHG